MTVGVVVEPRIGKQLPDRVVIDLRTELLQTRQQIAHVARYESIASSLRSAIGLISTADVCRWLGNSPAIAARHYAMPTAESFERAIESAVTVRNRSTKCTLARRVA